VIRREEFLKICDEERLILHERTGIGTYMEKRLHIVLKKYMDPDVTHHEFPMLGSVADIIVRGNREEIVAKLKAMSPVIIDVLPLNLEEVFIYEMEALGYAFKDVL